MQSDLAHWELMLLVLAWTHQIFVVKKADKCWCWCFKQLHLVTVQGIAGTFVSLH